METKSPLMLQNKGEWKLSFHKLMGENFVIKLKNDGDSIYSTTKKYSEDVGLNVYIFGVSYCAGVLD